MRPHTIARCAGVSARRALRVPPSPPSPWIPGAAREHDLRTFCYWMLGAVAVGLMVRLAYVYGWKWDQPLAVANSDGFGGDAGYYHTQANVIAEGLWFVDPWLWAFRKTGVFPGAEHPPLYTLFLSIPSSLGFQTFREHVVAGTILGSITCGVTGFAGGPSPGGASGSSPCSSPRCTPTSGSTTPSSCRRRSPRCSRRSSSGSPTGSGAYRPCATRCSSGSRAASPR